MNNFKSKFLSKSPLNQERPTTLPTQEFSGAENEMKVSDITKVYPDRLNSEGETQMEKMNQANEESREAVNAFNESDDNKGELYRLAMEANKRPGIVSDSINNANLKIDKLISAIKSGDY